MSVKRLPIEALPPGAFQRSELQDTKEWKLAVREIERGLTPHEAVRIRIEKDTIASIPLKDPVRAFYVKLKRFATVHKYPVDVLQRANESGEGFDIWLVGR